MKSRLLIFLALTVISGCATVLPPEQSAYMEKVRAFPLEFSMPKTAEHDAWGRAQTFIGKHSSMKLQTATDFVINTYNPLSASDIGYNITKTPHGDSIDLSVEAIGGKDDFHLWASERNDNAHILAWYIESGELPYPKLISR
ncbi:MAG: hypothetical protein ABIQ57_00925 [Candidatus Kapaibacterium sp.]